MGLFIHKSPANHRTRFKKYFFSSVSSLRGRPPKGEKGDRHRHHRKKSKRDSIIRVQVDLTDDIFEKHKVTFYRNHGQPP